MSTEDEVRQWWDAMTPGQRLDLVKAKNIGNTRRDWALSWYQLPGAYQVAIHRAFDVIKGRDNHAR